MEKYIADRLVTVTVDMQNDFMPGGSLPVTEGDAIIPLINELTAYTREQGGIVVETGDQHPAITPHFGPDAWPVHCVAGTDGAALRSDLFIGRDDIQIDKGMGQTDGYSGFEGISIEGDTLEALVKPSGRERVAVLMAGVATEYCVKNTALDALKVQQGDGTIKVFIARDAVRGVNVHPDDSQKALDEMEQAGAILIDSIDVLTHTAFEIAR